jgi:hypothetical protein
MRDVPLPFGPPIGWRPLRYLLDVGSSATSGATDFVSTLAGRQQGRGVLSLPLPL